MTKRTSLSMFLQGKLRVPTPRNITPGPGFYFKVPVGTMDATRL